MVKINSSIKKELYKIELKSATGNVLIADEPIDKGGRNQGFSPKELLASALAACTSATIRMYADRKEWDLQEVKIDISLDDSEGITSINRRIEFIGELTQDQKKRLIAVANACPVHKILTNTIEINTTALEY